VAGVGGAAVAGELLATSRVVLEAGDRAGEAGRVAGREVLEHAVVVERRGGAQAARHDREAKIQ